MWNDKPDGYPIPARNPMGMGTGMNFYPRVRVWVQISTRSLFTGGRVIALPNPNLTCCHPYIYSIVTSPPLKMMFSPNQDHYGVSLPNQWRIIYHIQELYKYNALKVKGSKVQRRRRFQLCPLLALVVVFISVLSLVLHSTVQFQNLLWIIAGRSWHSSWVAGSKDSRILGSNRSSTAIFWTWPPGVRWNICEDIYCSSIQFLSSIL
jgi:hypothetical protein